MNETRDDSAPRRADPADGPVTFVEDRAGLEDMAARVRNAEVVALDVEANSLHAYRERVCVVQATLNGENFIVDPLALENLDPLRDALDTPEIETVFHGGDFDIASLTRDHDFRFHRVFDTMIAAMLLGEERIGLAHLVEASYGITLDKRFQKADWGKRPLTPEQIAYLYRDTAYLPPLVEEFREKLADADLVEEADIEFARVARRQGVPPTFDPEGWRRVKGSSRLDGAGRAVMAGLWRWRDGEAERRNVPPFKIVGPKNLLAIAEAPPKKARDPRDVPGLHPRERRRSGWAILDAIRDALREADEGRVPRHTLRVKASPEDAARHRMESKIEEAIRAWRKGEAQTRKVPNLVVLPNKALVWITHEMPRDVAELAACTDIGPKRTERYGEQLVKLVAKVAR